MGVPRSTAVSWLPDGAAKEKILTAIARAQTTLQLAVVLRVLGLSPMRYHAWNRLERACQLDDRSRCPRTTQTQLTAVKAPVPDTVVLYSREEAIGE